MGKKKIKIEKFFLSEKEIEYIKKTIIYMTPLEPEVLELLSWRGKLEMKTFRGTATPEEKEQYERLVEIDLFVYVLSEKAILNPFDLKKRMEMASPREQEFLIAKIKSDLDFYMKEDFDKKRIEEIMFKKINHKSEKLKRIDSDIKSAGFQRIDDKTILSMAYLILREINFAEKNNKKLRIGIDKIDKNVLAYLAITKLKELQISINEEPKNVYAKACPADAIREYIEKKSSEQQECRKRGEEIPEQLLIPQEINLSSENIKFLLESKKVDYIGAGEAGDEIKFYWKKTDEAPALELRVKKKEDGKYILTYIREEATKDKQEFLWDRNSENGKKGIITISKTTDALEDICDMDEKG